MALKSELERLAILSEIDDLPHKTVAELQIRYLEVFGEPSRSNHKQFLIRRIAWRLQAVAEGDLSERARDRSQSRSRRRSPAERAAIGRAGSQVSRPAPGPTTTTARHHSNPKIPR